MTGWSGRSASVGRIVFLTLLCMSLGVAAIGFVAVFGIQSFRQEFDRMIETDLPQATVATRLNAEVSGLTSLVGLLLTAQSEIALGTIRIQTGDQLGAIDRQKELLRNFELRPGEYTEIDETLQKLVKNLDALTTLGIRRIRAKEAFHALSLEVHARADTSENAQSYLLWFQDVETAARDQEIAQLAGQVKQIAGGSEWPELSERILAQRRTMLEIETVIQGRLNQHTLLSARLTDATRFMSSRLISEANTRSASIQSQIQTNLYLILACFLAIATVGAFIYVYLDRHVVGRIQDLTRKMNDHEGRQNAAVSSPNEINQLETSFANMANAIAERESRLVALNKAATEARRDAEKANTSKSTLLAAASHDLRQPIHAMGLLIGSIDKEELSDATRQAVGHLADLTQETVRLFNSVLDLSKLEAGTFTATLIPIDLSVVFSRLENDLRLRAESAGAVLDIHAVPAGTFVNADEDALYRILSNLIVNAIDYASDAEISVGSEQGKGGLTVFVSDNGPGLNLDREATQDSNDPTESTGYGLGLSISFALATAMQTKLTFQTPSTGGTRFALPLQTSAPTEETRIEKQPNNRAIEPLSDLNIVFLEDNPDVHIATLEALSRFGCTVYTCRTQEEAKRRIVALQSPFVLVSDLDLGRGHSARDLIAETMANTPHLIAVIVTTASRVSTEKLWKDLPDVHVLEKPFSISRLTSMLRHLVSCKKRS